jgi:methionine synthase II (cobalamin-independent)
MNHLRTEFWDGELRWGDNVGTKFYGIGGIKNPIFQLIVARIIDEVEFLDEFELFVHGGILEDWTVRT